MPRATAANKSAQRLATAWHAGEAAGVTRIVGWEARRVVGWSDGPTRIRRVARADSVSKLAAGPGAGLEEIAQAVCVSTATVRRASSGDAR